MASVGMPIGNEGRDAGSEERDKGAGRNRNRVGFGVSDADASLRSMEYVFLANWTGCPAVSAPIGYLHDDRIHGEGKGKGKEKERQGGGGGGDAAVGMVPVGIMGMGEWGSEEALMDWVEEGEGFLPLGVAADAGSGGGVEALSERGEVVVVAEENGEGKGGGVRKPNGWEGAWVDILKRAGGGR